MKFTYKYLTVVQLSASHKEEGKGKKFSEKAKYTD